MTKVEIEKMAEEYSTSVWTQFAFIAGANAMLPEIERLKDINQLQEQEIEGWKKRVHELEQICRVYRMKEEESMNYPDIN